MGAKLWTCGVCERPISAGKGYVVLTDPKTNGHPLPPSERRKREEEDVARLRLDVEAARNAGDVEGAKTKEAIVAAWDRAKAPSAPGKSLNVTDYLLLRFIEYPPVAFTAMHAACDPDPEAASYWFGVERAATLDQWVAWAHHVAAKGWMTKADIRLMLGFWYANRGAALPWT